MFKSISKGNSYLRALAVGTSLFFLLQQSIPVGILWADDTTLPDNPLRSDGTLPPVPVVLAGSEIPPPPIPLAELRQGSSLERLQQADGESLEKISDAETLPAGPAEGAESEKEIDTETISKLNEAVKQIDTTSGFDAPSDRVQIDPGPFGMGITYGSPENEGTFYVAYRKEGEEAFSFKELTADSTQGGALRTDLWQLGSETRYQFLILTENEGQVTSREQFSTVTQKAPEIVLNYIDQSIQGVTTFNYQLFSGGSFHCHDYIFQLTNSGRVLKKFVMDFNTNNGINRSVTVNNTELGGAGDFQYEIWIADSSHRELGRPVTGTFRVDNTQLVNGSVALQPTSLTEVIDEVIDLAAKGGVGFAMRAFVVDAVDLAADLGRLASTFHSEAALLLEAIDGGLRFAGDFITSFARNIIRAPEDVINDFNEKIRSGKFFSLHTHVEIPGENPEGAGDTPVSNPSDNDYAFLVDDAVEAVVFRENGTVRATLFQKGKSETVNLSLGGLVQKISNFPAREATPSYLTSMKNYADAVMKNLPTKDQKVWRTSNIDVTRWNDWSWLSRPWQSQTLVAGTGGLWSSGSTWVGGVPPPNGAEVRIGAGQVVDFDVSMAGNFYIEKLVIDPNATMFLSSGVFRVGTVIVRAGGRLQIGTPLTPVTATIEFTGGLNKIFDPFQEGLGLVVLGEIDVHGQDKTSGAGIEVAGDMTKGQTQFTLQQAVTGWNVGDDILFPGTGQFLPGSTVREAETYKISWISPDGKTFGIGQPLINNHLAARNMKGEIVGNPPIANMTRTVKFISDPNNPAHALFTDKAKVSIFNAEFNEMGRTKLGKTDDTIQFSLDPNNLPKAGDSTMTLLSGAPPLNPGDEIVFDAATPGGVIMKVLSVAANTVTFENPFSRAVQSIVAYRIGMNQKGRYAIHAHHMLGNPDPNSTSPQLAFVNNVVNSPDPGHDPKWGINLHHSEFNDFERNTVIGYGGASINVEDDGKNISAYNHIVNNWVTGTTAISYKRASDSVAAGEIGQNGTGFWLRGQLNYVDNNLVVDNRGGSYQTAAYTLENINLFLVDVPNFPGADCTLPGQCTTVEGSSIPILSFSNNTAFGVSLGLTYYDLGTRAGRSNDSWQPSYPNVWPNLGPQVINNFTAFNTHYGVIHYPTTAVWFINLGLFADAAKCATTTCIGFWGLDYRANGLASGSNILYDDASILLDHADIEGFRQQFIGTTDTDGSPQVIRDSYLDGGTGIFVPRNWTSAYESVGMKDQEYEIINTRFGPHTKTSIQVESGGENQLVFKNIEVIGYNGDPNDNFYLLPLGNESTAPIKETTASIGLGHLPKSIGAPVPGLTRGEASLQYGIGNPNPPGGVPKAGIVGALVSSVPSTKSLLPLPQIQNVQVTGDPTDPTIWKVTFDTVGPNGPLLTYATLNWGQGGANLVRNHLTNWDDTDTLPKTTHQITISGVTPGKPFYYQIHAYNLNWEVAHTPVQLSSTSPLPPDTTPPTLLAVASSGITSSATTITWNTNEASDTQLEYGTDTSYGSSTTLNSAMVTSHNVAMSGLTASTLYHFRVKSRDAAGNLATSADFTFTTTAAVANRPPVFAAIGAQSVNENQMLSFTVSATDPDGTTPTLSASGLPQGATFNSASGAFSWTPDFSQSGNYSVAFLANDGTNQVPAAVQITVNNVNRTPTGSSQTVTTAEDTAKNITLGGTDPDGDPLTYSIVSGPANGALGPINGAIVPFTPAANFNGSTSFVYQACDPSNACATATASITVTPVNDAPTLASIGNQTIDEGQMRTLSLSATDVDTGDTLSFSLTGAPSFITLTNNGNGAATLAIKPNTGDAANYSVTVTATDQSGASASQILQVTVNVPPSQPPPEIQATQVQGQVVLLFREVDNTSDNFATLGDLRKYRQATAGQEYIVRRSTDGVVWTQVGRIKRGSGWFDPYGLLGPTGTNTLPATTFIVPGSNAPLPGGTAVFVYTTQPNEDNNVAFFKIEYNDKGKVTPLFTTQTAVTQRSGEQALVEQEVTQANFLGVANAELHYFTVWHGPPYARNQSSASHYLYALKPGVKPEFIQLGFHHKGASLESGFAVNGNQGWFTADDGGVFFSTTEKPDDEIYDSWFWGRNDGGVVRDFVIARIWNTVNQVQRNLGLSSRTVGRGYSMGAGGVFNVAIRYAKEFNSTFVIGENGPTDPSSLQAYKNSVENVFGKFNAPHLPFESVINGETDPDVWNYFNSSRYLVANRGKRIAQIELAYSLADTAIVGTQGSDLVRTLRAERLPFSAQRGTNGHGQRYTLSPEREIFLLSLQPGQAQVAFDNGTFASGTPDDDPNSPSGAINEHFAYDANTIFDLSYRFAATLRLLSTAPESSADVDVTPQSFQQFQVRAGDVVNLKNTDLTTGLEVQNINVTVDNRGLITARLKMTKGGNRIEIIPVNLSSDTTAPAVPTGVSATAGDGQLTIAWTANTETDLAGYNVYRSTSANGTYAKVNNSPVIGTTYTDTGLTNGTTYYYKPTAVDQTGNESAQIATSVSATPNLPPDTTAPVISAVLASLITSSGATLNWATDEASDSQVEYGTTNAYGSNTPLNSSLLTNHSVALSGLLLNTLYHYRVLSRDGAGNLQVSGDFTFTTSYLPLVIANPIPNLTVNEDVSPSTMDLAGVFSGGNGTLTYSVTSNSNTSLVTPTLAGSTLTLAYRANQNGPAAIMVRATDQSGAFVETSFGVTVNPVNDAPVANAQNVTATEDTAFNGTLGASDVDGNALTYSIVNQGTNGTVTITNAATGAFTYTPNANVNGADTFTFRVNDGALNSATATVTVNITAVNDVPVANAQSVTATEDTAIAITLMGSDIEGSALTFAVLTQPTHGTLSGTGANLTYTPAANYNGLDSFTFTASDGSLTSGPVTVALNVTAVNDPPVANAQSVTTNEDASKTITLSATDVDGDSLTYVVVSQPTHGALTGSGTDWTYTPAANYNGPDSFAFKASDGIVDSAVVTVSLTINPVNDPPVANPQSVTTNEDSPVTITLTGSDIEGDPLSFHLTGNPTHGSLSCTNNTCTYTPDANYNGADSFTFAANDGALDSNVVAVNLTIDPVNDAPTISTIAAQSTNKDTATGAIAFTIGDVETAAAGLTVTASSSNTSLVPNSSIVLGGNGTNRTLTITPAANQSGTSTITLTVSDGTATSTQTFSLTVKPVTITPVNSAPVINGAPSTRDVNEGATLTLTGVSVSDKDNTWGTLTLTAGNAKLFLNGSVLGGVSSQGIQGNGTNIIKINSTLSRINKTLNSGLTASGFSGNDYLEISIRDDHSETKSSIAINFIPANQPPVLSAIGDQAAQEGQLLQFTLSATDANLQDILSYSATGLPTGAAFDPATLVFSWTPDFTQAGIYTVSFAVTDGKATDSQTIQINVANMNRLPVVPDVVLTTPEDTSITGSLAASSVSDPDGDPLTFSLVSAPSDGSLTLNADGSFNFTPPLNFSGQLTFTYIANDGTGNSNPATVTINVTPVNDPPSIGGIAIDGVPVQQNQNGNSTITVPAERRTRLALLTNDPDGGDAPLSWTAFLGLPGKRASIDPVTGEIVMDFYTSDIGSTYTMTCTASDGSTVTIQIVVV